MTTPYTIPADLLAGKTVAVYGNGPQLTPDFAATIAADYHIAANRAALKLPHVDMIVSIDCNWPTEVEATGALRICGVPHDADALFVHLPVERTEFAPGNVVEIRNNAISAIRIAANAGARRVLLVGFALEHYERGIGPPVLLAALPIALAALVSELRAKGIDIEFVEPAPVPKARKSWSSAI